MRRQRLLVNKEQVSDMGGCACHSCEGKRVEAPCHRRCRWSVLCRKAIPRP